ncbi:MAG: hypothetical protein HY303_21490 [Candidatus Wallbacteria bacterium]|nr:hypothetical protein [Candidatus Wallbacteria bacterium]
MKRLARTLRLLDDLLEVLVLHVLLATPGRRKVVSAACLLGAMALYAASGFLLAPVPQLASVTVDAAPYATGWNDPAGFDVRGQVLSTGRIAPGDAEALEATLAANEATLDRAVSLTEEGCRTMFCKTPSYRMLRRLTDALVARGIQFVSRGLIDDALRQFSAVVRIGRIAAWGGSKGPVFIEGMIGCAIERSALRPLTELVFSGRMKPAQARYVLQRLDPRATRRPTVEQHLRGERYALHCALDDYAADNRWPADQDEWLLRLVLPARDAGRKAAAEELSRRVDGAIARLVHAVERHVPVPGPREVCEEISGCHSSVHEDEPGPLELLAGVVLPGAGLDLATCSLLERGLPNLRVILERLALRDAEVRDLTTLCEFVSRR